MLAKLIIALAMIAIFSGECALAVLIVCDYRHQKKIPKKVIAHDFTL